MNKFSENFKHYRSNGKLMLSGEYLVLKGALSLALPSKFGQDMYIERTLSQTINWESQVKGKQWFKGEFDIETINIISSNKLEISKTLQQILKVAKELNPGYLNNASGYNVKTNIDFNIEWGLGSSSSLVSNVAFWANCDPFELNRLIFKGSGYDIACASSNSAVLYKLIDNEPVVNKVDFNPSFSDQLYFVWLNRKQNTREGIGQFEFGNDYSTEIELLNEITVQMIKTSKLTEFQKLTQMHEKIVANVLKTVPIQQKLFVDFEGSVKSLGAWGGDFIMVSSSQSFTDLKNYFNQKGFETVLKYNEIVL